MALSKKAQQFLEGYKTKAQTGLQTPYIDPTLDMSLDYSNPFDYQPNLQAAQNFQTVGMSNPGMIQDPANAQQQAQPLNTALGMLGPAGKLAMGAHQLIKSAKERKEAKLMDKMFREDNKRRMENARGQGYYMTPYTVGRTTDYTMKDGGQIKNKFRPTKRNTWKQAVEGLGFDKEYLQEGGWLTDWAMGDTSKPQIIYNEGYAPTGRMIERVDSTTGKVYSVPESNPFKTPALIQNPEWIQQESFKNTLPGKSKSKERFREMQMGGQPSPIDQFMQMYYNQQNSQNQLNQSIADTYAQQSQALENKWKQNRTQGFQNLASGTMDGVKMAMGMMQEGGPVQEPVKDTESLYSPDFQAPWEGEEFNNEMQEWFMEDDGNQGDPEIAAMYDQVMSMPVMENPGMDSMVAPIGTGGTASAYKGDTPYESIVEKIGYNESRGRYDVVNDKTQTVGKYQFMEKYWADKIRNFMGLPANLSKREVMTRFKENPEAQEKYMRHAIKTEYEPHLPKMRKLAEKYGFNDEQLIRLMHYRGVSDAYKRLQSGDFKVKQEEKEKYNNPDVLEYLNK